MASIFLRTPKRPPSRRQIGTIIKKLDRQARCPECGDANTTGRAHPCCAVRAVIRLFERSRVEARSVDH